MGTVVETDLDDVDDLDDCVEVNGFVNTEADILTGDVWLTDPIKGLAGTDPLEEIVDNCFDTDLAFLLDRSEGDIGLGLTETERDVLIGGTTISFL